MTAQEATPAGWGCDVLRDELVVDLSSGLAGAYCTALLAQAGATVVSLQDPGGDSMRRSPGPSSTGDGADGPLWSYLRQSKRSITIAPYSTSATLRVMSLLDEADVIVWSRGSRLATRPELAPRELTRRHPSAIVCSITPFGLDGPWADRPATDLTLQAWAGGIAHRGDPGRPPLRSGGEATAWAAATSAAVGILTARHRARKSGHGDLIDLSVLEATALTCAMTFPVTFHSIAGRPLVEGRSIALPGIHPCADGWIGFMVLTGQQWLDFCVLVERSDWLEDPSLLLLDNRRDRQDELVAAIERWTRAHTTAEILDAAAGLRVPAAPVGDGRRTPGFEQIAQAGYYENSPDRRFLQPVPHYRFVPDGARRMPTAAPIPGGDNGASIRPARTVAASTPTPRTGARPLEDLRVADLTAFWAGPVVGRYLALMGADVIKVESPHRPDGFRAYTTTSLESEQWWEWAPMMQGCNVGKRDLAIDLSTEAGQEILLGLAESCDVLVENFTPRVLESWNLAPERLLAANPDLVVVRMPAFGLQGPWRDRPGYAQTVEQMSGLAWITGYPDGPPVAPSGQCDPLAGNFALIALLLALEQRRRTGAGLLVECPLVLGALQLAVEQVAEYGATGTLLTRTGNRTAGAVQGVYATSDPERWVAISVVDEDQWQALRTGLGAPRWFTDLGAFHDIGPRGHDRFDDGLASWCAARGADDIVHALWPAGIPVAAVLPSHEQSAIPQLDARGFFETVVHPVTGPNVHATLPMRMASVQGQWHRRCAPLLGEHNIEILRDLLRLDPAAIDVFAAVGVIGDRLLPLGGRV